MKEPRTARFGSALVLALPLSAVGGMIGSVYAPRSELQNDFVLGGLAAGALVGWTASRAASARTLGAWSLVISAICGAIAFAPLARRLGEGVLLLSGASLGTFLGVPVYLLALPAFYGRKRAARARERSIVRGADEHATWASSAASVALLGLLGQPVLLFGGRLVRLSVPVLVASTLASLALVASDLRAMIVLARLKAPAAEDAPSPSGTADVGLGDERVERREPTSSPFRSPEKVVEVLVGNVRAGKRALARSLLLDGGTLVLSVLALVFRALRR